MTMSVGLGRIINDPEAPILTRKALGALSRPGLLVLDKGLTIDSDGRIVLRITPGSALSEGDDGLAVNIADEGGLETGDGGLSVLVVPGGGLELFSDGLAVKLASGGGIESSDDGLALGDFGTITVTGINVSGNAFVDGDIDAVGSIGTISRIACASITVSGAASSGSLSTGAITCSSVSASGAVTAASATISGALSVGSFSPSSLTVSGNASIGGTLSAGVFSPSSISTGAITCTSITVSSSAAVTGAVGIGTSTLTAKCNVLSTTEQMRLLYDSSNYLKTTVASNGTTTIQAVGTNAAINLVPSGTGRVNVTGSATITGNTTVLGSMAVSGDIGADNIDCDSITADAATINGNLTVSGTITSGGGGSSGAITPTSVRINSGTTIIRCLSFFVSLAFSGTAYYRDFFFTTPGVAYGDAVHCSPLGHPGNTTGAWSAWALDNQVVIRIHGEGGPSGPLLQINTTFRVAIFGFA